MRGLLLTAAILAAGSAHGEIYKCTINGEVIFSQQPCGENAETVQLKLHQPQKESAAAAATPATPEATGDEPAIAPVQEGNTDTPRYSAPQEPEQPKSDTHWDDRPVHRSNPNR